MTAISTDVESEGLTFAGTFWVHGVLSRALITLCFFGLTLFQPLPMVFLASIMATDLAAFIWALLRFHSAAQQHLVQTGRFWTICSGYLFFFFAAIATIVLWLVVVSGAQTTTPARIGSVPDQSDSNLRIAMPTGERFVTEITVDERQLIVKGVMAQSLVEKMDPYFDKSGRIDTIVLHSAGGNLFEARILASDILRRGLDTHVANECSASCLLAFMAGQNRTLGPGAQLGFHRYGIDFAQVLPHVSPLREMRLDQQYYLKRGVPMDFLDQVLDLDRKAIWYPTRRELLAAGIITQ